MARAIYRFLDTAWWDILNAMNERTIGWANAFDNMIYWISDNVCGMRI